MNNFVEWKQELSIGLQEIDEQHKILIRLLNELYQAITDDAEKNSDQ
jgi:hemerythrin